MRARPSRAKAVKPAPAAPAAPRDDWKAAVIPMLEAVASERREDARAAASSLALHKEVAPVASATRAWADVDPEQPIALFVALAAVLKAAESSPVAEASSAAPMLTRAKEAAAKPIADELAQLDEKAQRAFLVLNCEDAKAAIAAAKTRADALGRAPAVSADGCGALADGIRSRLASDVADAYAAWYAHAVRLGRRPALDGGALEARSKTFAKEYAVATKAVASRDPRSLSRADEWPTFVDAPVVALGWIPELRARVDRDMPALAGEATRATSFPALKAPAVSLCALARLRGEEGELPPRATLDQLFVGAQQGRYMESRDAWARLERGGSASVKQVAARARAIAASEFVERTKQAAERKKYVAVAQHLAAARLLDSTSEKVLALDTKLRPYLESHRASLIGKADAADKPALMLQLWDDVLALDAATTGPSTKIADADRERIHGALIAFAKGDPTKVFATLPAIKPSAIDIETSAAKRLVSWGRTWGMGQISSLRAKKEFIDAESTLRTLLAFAPNDTEAQALVASVAQEARGQRSARVEAAFTGGRPATAEVMLLIDPQMTADDKEAIRKAHGRELAELRDKLTIRGSVHGSEDLTNKVARGLTASGPGWALTSQAGDPSSGTAGGFHSVELRLTSRGLQVPQPRLVRTETGHAKYQQGFDEHANPAKAQCEQDVESKTARLTSAEESLASIEEQNRVCQEKAKELAEQKGGAIWGFAGATACSGVTESVRGSVTTARRELQAARSTCAGTSATVKEAHFEEISYPIEHWAIDAKGEVDLAVLDASHGGAPIADKHLEHSVHAEDRHVKGQPSRNVPDDPLQLRSATDIENEIVRAIAAQVAPAFDAATKRYGTLIEGDARAATGAQRAELFARLVVLDEMLGISSPQRTQWRTEVATFAYPAAGGTASETSVASTATRPGEAPRAAGTAKRTGAVLASRGGKK